MFAPAGQRGRRPLQSRVLTFSSKSIQSIPFDKILIKGDFLLIVTGAPTGYTKAIPNNQRHAGRPMTSIGPCTHPRRIHLQEVRYVLFQR